MENSDKKTDLIKWVINTVVIGLLTFFFNWALQERKQGIEEVKAYDKYVELVTNVDGLAERRLLAEFFSNVTPSSKLKKGWKIYYDTLNNQYQRKLKESKLTINKADTITIKGRSKYQKAIEVKEALENVGITNPIIAKKNPKLALEWELKGFNELLEKNIETAIVSFEKSENAYNQFHQVYEIALYLKKHKNELRQKESQHWKTIYKTLVSSYSWKMPIEIKKIMIEKYK